MKQKHLETIFLSLAIAIKYLFLYYIYFQAKTLTPREDAWAHTYMIVTTVKYGPLNVPWKYPPLFIWLWSIPLYITGLHTVQQVIQYVVALGFINTALATIAYYHMAKKLTKNFPQAALATLIWLFISGFSWTYLLFNPPKEPRIPWLIPFYTTDKEYLTLIYKIWKLYGTYSGAVHTPTCTDGHILVRLLALTLLFTGITTYINALQQKKTKHIILTAIIYTLITAGHLIEAPPFALAITTLIILYKPDKKTIKQTLLTAVIASIIALLILSVNTPKFASIGMALSYYPVCLSYPLGVILGFLIMKALSATRKSLNAYKIIKKINNILVKSVLFIIPYIYGLSIIAFHILICKNQGIYLNYYPQWYMYPIEWGFIGLFALIALVIKLKTSKKVEDSIKFSIVYLIFMLILINILNIMNYHLSFIMYPFPIQPVLFYPFLAIIASHIIFLFKIRKTKYILYILLFLFFTFGSIDNLISANYWRIVNGRLCFSAITLNEPEYQLLNYLLKQKPPNAKILTLYPWHNPLSYMTMLAGYNVPPEPHIHLYWHINNTKELNVIWASEPVDYILVAKKHSIPIKGIGKILNNTSITFKNQEYILYTIPQNIINKTSIKLSREITRISKLSFEGSISTKIDSQISIYKGYGKILSLNETAALLIINKEKYIILPVNATIVVRGVVIFYDIVSFKNFQRVSIIDDNATLRGYLKFVIKYSSNTSLYLEDIIFQGKIKFCHIMPHLTLQEKIRYYAQTRWISLIEAITHKYGMMWTTLYIIALEVLKLIKRLPRMSVLFLLRK